MLVIKVPLSSLEGFCSQGMEGMESLGPHSVCPCASIREKSKLHVSVSLTFSSLALQTKILEGNSLFFSVSKTKTQDLAGMMPKIAQCFEQLSMTIVLCSLPPRPFRMNRNEKAAVSPCFCGTGDSRSYLQGHLGWPGGRSCKPPSQWRHR